MLVPVLALQPLQLGTSQILDLVQPGPILFQNRLNPRQRQPPLIRPKDPRPEIVVRDVDGDVPRQVGSERGDQVEELFGTGRSGSFARDRWFGFGSDADVAGEMMPLSS